MAIVAFGLWMLLEFSSILTAESLHWSKVCESNQLKYLSFSDQILFYINGNTVDRMTFCKSLNRYHASDCVPSSSFQEWEEVGMRYCGLEVSLEELPQRFSRKILEESRRESVSHDLGQQSHETEENHDRSSLLSPKTMAMAVPGMFLLSCFIFCPCFQSKRKETDHAVLTKNPNSTDSVSSVEISSSTEKVPRRSSSIEKVPRRSSSTEKAPNSPRRVPASPFRMPGSPKRVPPSPMRVPPSPSRFSMSPKLTKIGSVHLSMTQVMNATHNFSPSLQVGEGGFGTVYRAELQDGQVVAMKRAKKELFDTLRGEFSSEIELLTKIEHRNLVKLLGYVDKGSERIIITEYVPNGTLRDHLDGQRGRILDFNQRLEISIDIAHALTYLHLYTEKQIIHRDVKSSNILLTESCRAKVADFGFARLGPTEGEQTYVVTKVKGTVGYLDPEYLKTHQLTPKSDVYSFGILLVEILTGRRPVELRREVKERVTVRWAFSKYNEGNIFEILDPLLNEVIDADILSKMFDLAFQCAAPTRLDRPNMKEVGEQLWAIRMDYSRSVRKAG